MSRRCSICRSQEHFAPGCDVLASIGVPLDMLIRTARRKNLSSDQIVAAVRARFVHAGGTELDDAVVMSALEKLARKYAGMEVLRIAELRMLVPLLSKAAFDATLLRLALAQRVTLRDIRTFQELAAAGNDEDVWDEDKGVFHNKISVTGCRS